MNVAAIGVAVGMLSCQNQKPQDIETPVEGTNYAIVETPEHTFGVKQGLDFVITPIYQNLVYEKGYFIGDMATELFGDTTLTESLLDPQTDLTLLSGTSVEYVADGNYFVSEAAGLYGIFFPETKKSFEALQQYIVVDDVILLKKDGWGIYKQDETPLLETGDAFKKVVWLKGQNKFLVFSDNTWFLMTKYGEDFEELTQTALKKYKKMSGWEENKEASVILP